MRVILDPNKDAFGRTKNGIPNRSVATELAAASDGAIKVRWFRTHGEQFHSKLVADAHRHGILVHAGIGQSHAPQSRRFQSRSERRRERAAERGDRARRSAAWFDSLWTNRGPPELEYTAEFGTYADPSQGTYWLYRLMEATGLSTF